MKYIFKLLKILQGSIVIVIFLLSCVQAQTLPPHIIKNTYNNETEIKASKSITLADGFYIPAGKTVRIYTEASFASCVDQVNKPSANQNYISTRVFKISGVTEANRDVPRNTCEVNQTIQYMDGLGRPQQTITVQGSPTFKDVVQPVFYDALGREAIKYLPYGAQTGEGNFKTDALSKQGDYYSEVTSWDSNVIKTANPYSKIIFEASPLNRTLEQGFPGFSWQPASSRGINQGRTVVSDYGTNTANEVKLWKINGNGASAEVYQPNTLYKVTIKDENWVSGKTGTVEEFKDLEGQVVLKRHWETEGKSLSTYYVYDDLGNLCYVLPPAVNEGTDRSGGVVNSFTEADALFEQFIFGYHYDGRKRVIEKKMPGKGWEFMVYNKLDQLVLSQDAKQRLSNQWAYSKYDVLGRVISTGLYTDAASRTFLEASLNAQTVLYESRTEGSDYSNAALPQSGAEVLTVNYYDNYGIPGLPNNQSTNYTTKLNGLLTASRVKVLNSTDELWTVNYYDKEARVVKVYGQHYKGGSFNVGNYDEVENTYNFADQLTASTRSHHAGATLTTIATRHEYDHMGRKKASFESINGASELVLSKLDYNEVGQLIKKSLHSTDGTNFLQYSTYAYNPRGWLKSSTSDQFNLNLQYNEGVVPQYNGNIAAQQWGAGLANTFNYSYDALNRLLSGVGSGPAAAGKSEALSYDVMGNIMSLNRNGALGTYSYTGNRLNQVTGGLQTGVYAYDVNGNAITDGRNGVTIVYNKLDLPATVNKGGLSMAYTYDAAGTKLRKVSNGTSRDYIDGIEYNGADIDIIHTEEGVARRIGTDYSYEYNLTDHLGNVRYTFHKHPLTGALEGIQSDDYYPFGKRFADGGVNKYLYNGKELQDELGQLDYGARFYDPEIGRWNVVDPLTEKKHSVNSYAYTDNNPVNNVDPNGMETLYGFAAENAVAELQRQLRGSEEEKENPDKQNSKPGYFRSFYDASKTLRPFEEAGKTWERWLSSKSTFGSDMWNLVSNTYWGIASLTNADTYINWFKGQKQYWSSSSAEKGQIDARAVSDLIQDFSTYAPMGAAATDARVSKIAKSTKDFLTFNANKGYGVKKVINEHSFDLMYQNPRANGVTFFHYKNTITGTKFRLDYHVVVNEKRSLHYHTNLFGNSMNAHFSLNPFKLGKRIK